MKYLSLFSGIGGFELGITQAYEDLRQGRESGQVEGVRERESNTSRDGQNEQYPTCIGYSEIDKYAVQIYQSHFPEHKNYGDITKINETELPDFDLLVGGFPCQSFSIAGKRGGFNDTRGTMFFEIARILKHKKPRLLLLENVKGLLSHDEGRTFSTIISTLDELGYDLQWQVLNSKNFGVPQNRERVFIVGHLRGTSRPQVFPIGEGNPKDIVSSISATQGTKGIATRHLDRNGGLISDIASTVQVAETPHIIQLNQPTHSNDRLYGIEGISPTLNTAQGGNRQPKIPQYMADVSMMGHEGSPRMYHDIAPTLTARTYKEPPVVMPSIRRLTPTECERLQGFPDGWTEGVSDTQRYKTLGNAVTVNVIREIVKRI